MNGAENITGATVKPLSTAKISDDINYTILP